ncbi:MAG: hypothetical protein V1792_27980 [Pseudomonadota bacterium]
MDSEHAAKRHRELVEAGWLRRFTGEGPRVSEMSETYASLGMEVLLEPGVLGEETDCRTCFTAEGYAERCTTVYTRNSADKSDGPDDDLFE